MNVEVKPAHSCSHNWMDVNSLFILCFSCPGKMLSLPLWKWGEWAPEITVMGSPFLTHLIEIEPILSGLSILFHYIDQSLIMQD